MFRRILVLFALMAVVAAMVPTEAGQQYARIMNSLEIKNQEQARLLNNARGLLDGLLGGGAGILGGII